MEEFSECWVVNSWKLREGKAFVSRRELDASRDLFFLQLDQRSCRDAACWYVVYM